MFYIYLLPKCCGFFCVSLLRTDKKTSQTALRRSYCNFYLVLRCVFFDSLYSRTTCLCVLYYLPMKCCVFFVFPTMYGQNPARFRFARTTCLCVLLLLQRLWDTHTGIFIQCSSVCFFPTHVQLACVFIFIYRLSVAIFFCLYTRATCLCVLYLFTAQCKCCAFFGVFWNGFETLILGFLFSAQVFVLFLVRTVIFFFEYEIIHYVLK